MWFEGKVTPIWSESFKDFIFEKQPISENEVSMWRDQGYNHSSFTGKMYNSKNPMPGWCQRVADEIGLKNCGYVIYKMETNDIMPTHVDHFSRYCKVFNVNVKNVWRAAVFLEDWKPGHYFEIEGRAFCNYDKGSFVLWRHDSPHAAANIGVDDRYTLQITGTLR